MIMWAVLMGVLFILAFAGILYLSNRIGHFSFFRNLAHGKNVLQCSMDFWSQLYLRRLSGFCGDL